MCPHLNPGRPRQPLLCLAAASVLLSLDQARHIFEGVELQADRDEKHRQQRAGTETINQEK